MKKIVDEILPILTVSESNTHEHWTKSHKRHKAQKKAISLAFLIGQWIIELPCEVILTRLSPRLLDSHDNLPISFKWIADSIAECLLRHENMRNLKRVRHGFDDADPRIKWKYNQEKSKVKGIRLEIYS